MRILCPHCGSHSQIRTSGQLTKKISERYHQCLNVQCSCTFKSHTKIIGFIHKPLDISTLNEHDQAFLSDPKNATKKIRVPKTAEVGVSGIGSKVGGKK